MVNKFLIKNPLITEKSTALSEIGQYVFLVDKNANAPEIKKAIAKIYKVDVEDVRVINVKPKPRRYGNTAGLKAGYKKAIVQLKAGQKLDILPH